MSENTAAHEAPEPVEIDEPKVPKAEKEPKPRKADGLGELAGYDLSGAIIERRLVRDGGSLELRVALPAAAE